MWNIAHNLGGFAAPILAGTAARTLGWNVGSLQLLLVFFFLDFVFMPRKWGLWAPGIIALSVGLLIILTLKDSPEARGFTPVSISRVLQVCFHDLSDSHSLAESAP